jgi:hypothetical protein
LGLPEGCHVLASESKIFIGILPFSNHITIVI